MELQCIQNSSKIGNEKEIDKIKIHTKWFETFQVQVMCANSKSVGAHH